MISPRLDCFQALGDKTLYVSARKAMVYLIGVNHSVQHEGALNPLKSAEIERFKSHISESIKTNHITLIAEEFSDESIRLSGISRSVLQGVAAREGIEHRLCDPNTLERREHSIKKQDHRKREQFWLCRIADAKNQNILFVCGSDHVTSFKELLEQSGYVVQILSDGWGTN